MKPLLQKLWKNFLAQDWLAIAAVAALLAVGLSFIYSASWRGEEADLAGAWFGKQIEWACFGVALALVLSLVDYHVWIRWAWWIWLLAVLLLFAVLLFGQKVFGAARWINLFGILVQPSEFAKLATVILLARVLGGGFFEPKSFAFLLVGMLITALPVFLILREPDLGTAAVLLPVLVCMVVAGGGAWRYLFGLAAAGALLSPLAWLLLGEYQKDRILTFFDPSRDPLGANWNATQSAIAVGSGGFWGKGFLHGTQNILGFLPRTVSPSDFIFPVIAEEMGFVGSLVLLALFAFLLFRYLLAAATADDSEGSLLATGIAGLLFFHVFVNIGMTIRLLPITGLPLPFVSSGGSFLLTMFAGLGLVQSVVVRRANSE